MPTINDNPRTPPRTDHNTTDTQTCPWAPIKTGLFSNHAAANSSAKKRLDFTNINLDEPQQDTTATPSLGS